MEVGGNQPVADDTSLEALPVSLRPTAVKDTSEPPMDFFDEWRRAVIGSGSVPDHDASHKVLKGPYGRFSISSDPMPSWARILPVGHPELRAGSPSRCWRWPGLRRSSLRCFVSFRNPRRKSTGSSSGAVRSAAPITGAPLTPVTHCGNTISRWGGLASPWVPLKLIEFVTHSGSRNSLAVPLRRMEPLLWIVRGLCLETPSLLVSPEPAAGISGVDHVLSFSLELVDVLSRFTAPV